MNQKAKPIAMSEEPFDPLRTTVLNDGFEWQGGQRRVVATVPSVDLHWPDGYKAKHDAFRAWHQLAMQVISQHKASFRTIAVLFRFVNWKTGLIYPSNTTLIACAGRCSERTISRELALYEDLGIIRSRLKRHKKNNGNYITRRVMILTLPKDLAREHAMLSDDEGTEDDDFSLDTSGPGRNDDSIDSSGLPAIDSSGLVTDEGTVENTADEGDDNAA